MAIFMDKSNSLNKEYKKTRKASISYGVGIIVTSSISIVLFSTYLYLSLIAFLLMGYFLFKLTSNTINFEILRSGVEGEKRTERIFKRLPDEYYVHSDLMVEFEGYTSQLDHVVVGPTGIFVIETKNINGKIEGDGNQKYWLQHKTGSGGGKYENKFYSPIKQVGTHVFRLAGILKRNSINYWIESLVFFSNPKTKLEIKNEDIPVFSYGKEGSKRIIDYIINSESVVLSRKDIAKINETILKEC